MIKTKRRPENNAIAASVIVTLLFMVFNFEYFYSKIKLLQIVKMKLISKYSELSRLTLVRKLNWYINQLLIAWIARGNVTQRDKLSARPSVSSWS